MDKYYYLVSQLPFLKFDEKAPIDRKRLLQECKKWLSQKDYRVLASTHINGGLMQVSGPSVLGIYKEFYNFLKQELKEYRHARKEGREYKIAYPLGSWLLEGNPLEIEKNLLRAQWDVIEEIEKDHFFDLPYIILYYLKLQLLEALFTFDKDKGLAIFDGLSEVKI